MWCARHRAGAPVGIYSVCSAHPLVLRAALRHAQASGGEALIEATSNQVNQDGGYTGLTPGAVSRHGCWRLADEAACRASECSSAGITSGPNAWQSISRRRRRSSAPRVLIRRVRERRVPQDPSRLLDVLRGRPAHAADETIAARTAHAGPEAEAAWRSAGGEPPVYVVGTEVPVPGGAHESLQELAVTDAGGRAATVAAHRAALRCAVDSRPPGSGSSASSCSRGSSSITTG